MPSAASDLALIEDAARAAGAIARDAFGRTVATWAKGDASPVTEIDLAIDKFLTERLRPARPDYGWLSEETADNPERLSRARVFIVDPIDGTRAFIEGLPEFTISIAIIDHHAPALGCVYNPIRDEMYLGGAGVAAVCNGRPIQPTKRAELDGARLIGRADFYKDARWPTPWPPLDLEWRHSIAYRLALIAAGAFDGAVMLGYKNEWDTAGGAAILMAAGGSVTDMFGAALMFNQADPRAAGCLASGGPLHRVLIERVDHLPHPSDWATGRTTPPKEAKP